MNQNVVSHTNAERIWASCSKCGEKIETPNKGLGRAKVAAWETQHQHRGEVSARDTCYQLVSVDHGPLPDDYPLQVGSIAKFPGAEPPEATWNQETCCWVAMRWAVVQDPSLAAVTR